MKKTQLIFAGIATLLFSNTLFSQEKPKEWDASLYGFARADYTFDSRRSAQVREYQLNLYPSDVLKDVNGEDVNATSGSNFLSVVSRLGVKFKGPDVWGAKVSGTIEGDFFGNVEVTSTAGTGNIGSFRLRHAYSTMTWAKTALTFGQTWYPTFVTDVFPGTANFSTGILYNPFGFAPQIKLRQTLSKNLFFEAVAYKDREYQASSFTSNTQNAASFNSTVPTLHGKLEYRDKNIIAGVGAEYRTLRPSIDNTGTTVTTRKASTETLNSSLVMGYFKYSNDKVIAKLYGVSGSNLTNLVMLGGYASYPTTTGGVTTYTYKPTKTNAFWIDIASANPKVAPGAFFGYSKNKGVSDAVASTSQFFARGIGAARSVDNTWRASGRIDFKQNKFRISPELEYTSATWGDTQLDGTAGGTKNTVGNLRVLASVVYSF